MNRPELQEDTIVAIATPPGEGGIGVLRLSGPQAPKVLEKIWRGQKALAEFRSHQLYLGTFHDSSAGEEIDQGLAVWMKAPRSYTGEEVVEIHAHGGPLVLNRLLACLLEQGLRLAQPGEFTRRAFLNGKMDLLQAEAVGEMIHARSEAALRNAQAQLEGRLSQEIEKLRNEILNLLARVEAAIDFPEEDIEMLAPAETLAEIQKIQKTLEDWRQKFGWGRLIREGVRLVLVGRPNVGKSSLMNRLLGEDRAIVHASPGTTRDVIEGLMSWEGIGFQVFDTAGIRVGEGAVEREGISRSKQMMGRADLTLWVVDVSSPWTEEDRQIAESLRGKVRIVGNKTDRGVQLREVPPAWTPAGEWVSPEWTLISAKTGEGLEKLKKSLIQDVGLETLGDRSHAYLNNARHQASLLHALEALNRARVALGERLPAECVAADLQEATQALEALLGKVGPEEVLDKVFSEFCIGK